MWHLAVASVQRWRPSASAIQRNGGLCVKGIAAAGTAAAFAWRQKASTCSDKPDDSNEVSFEAGVSPSSSSSAPPCSRWVSREFQLPGEDGPIEMWEGRFVFADGTGVHIWPAAAATASYLHDVGLGSDAVGAGDPAVSAAESWRGRKVLELGCGCGLLVVALLRWGSCVVAVDASPKALDLASTNAARWSGRIGRAPQPSLDLRCVDWGDLGACEQLWRELGPFDAVVVSDGVLCAPPAGAMWHHATDAAQSMVSPPAPLLEATRVLARGGAEVIITVSERAGDVQATARALLDCRRWLELIGPPRELPIESGQTPVTRSPPLTVFHFRWREELGFGGENARQLLRSTE